MSSIGKEGMKRRQCHCRDQRKRRARASRKNAREGDVQRTINSAIAFLSSLVSGTFIAALPRDCDTDADSNSSPFSSPGPSCAWDAACSSPARRPISTSSALERSSSSPTSLCKLADCVRRCRSSSGVVEKERGGRGEGEGDGWWDDGGVGVLTIQQGR